MMWQLLAKLLALPWVAQWIYRRALRTPYAHLPDYMDRWWLFNAYDSPKHREWLPSIRMHHIKRPDKDPHLHDHPWNARTIILGGYYVEQKLDGRVYVRTPGDTVPLRFGEFHRIMAMHSSGAWTLFITWRYQGTWGFMVNGAKVPYKTYLGVE